MKIGITITAELGNYHLDNYLIELSDEDTIKEEIFEEMKKVYPELEEDNKAEPQNISFSVLDWGELEEYKNLQNPNLFEELAHYTGNYELDVISAGIDVDIQISDIDEAYAGYFSDDEKFAQDMAEQLGYINNNIHWPFTCIDWKYAARELMYDYTESNGHYFRNF